MKEQIVSAFSGLEPHPGSPGVAEKADARGTYTASCVGPRDPLDGERITSFVRGNPDFQAEYGDQCNIEAAKVLGIALVEKWADEFPNTVATIGKNLVWDQALAGSAYTVVGPYLGLISSTSFSATAAADTMTSHSGWLEAGNANAPTYTSPRKTAAWSSASAGAKALSASLSFAITGSGTVQGCFMVLGTGAVTTIDNTSGTLLSAGAFSPTKTVSSGDTVNVAYSIAM